MTTTDNNETPHELTLANYIGTDYCIGCDNGKLDEVLSISEDLHYCQDCIVRTFEAHWEDHE